MELYTLLPLIVHTMLRVLELYILVSTHPYTLFVLKYFPLDCAIFGTPWISSLESRPKNKFGFSLLAVQFEEAQQLI